MGYDHELTDIDGFHKEHAWVCLKRLGDHPKNPMADHHLPIQAAILLLASPSFGPHALQT